MNNNPSNNIANNLGKCALCGTTALLHNSHIVPKFVGQWIKNTSITGYLRDPRQPNVRRQDLDTRRLLCSVCEIRFSQQEALFAEQMFVPFQKKPVPLQFIYQEWLLYFAVSLAWRSLFIQMDSLFRYGQYTPLYADVALDQWRMFLLGESADPGPGEHHLFLCEGVKLTVEKRIAEQFHWYLLRGVDTVVDIKDGELFVYTKLPGMVFWAAIYPFEAVGWQNTLLHSTGTIQPGQEPSGSCWRMIAERGLGGAELLAQMSDRQAERVLQDMVKNTHARANLHTDRSNHSA